MAAIWWNINFNFFYMKSCPILHVVMAELDSLHLDLNFNEKIILSDVLQFQSIGLPP